MFQLGTSADVRFFNGFSRPGISIPGFLFAHMQNVMYIRNLNFIKYETVYWDNRIVPLYRNEWIV